MRTGRPPEKLLSFIMSAVVCCVVCSSQAASQTSADGSRPAEITTQAAKRQINLAGRQGMFSQKIAALVCLSELGRESDAKGLEVLQLRWFFRRTLKAFKDGDPVLGIAKANSARVVKLLDETEKVWKIKADSMDNWALFFSSAVPEIYDLSLQVLEGTEGIVRGMEQTYSDEKLVSASTLAALRIAGRQRMLAQRMTKEFCMVHSGYKAEESKAQLKISVGDFEKALANLTNGSQDLGLEKPPSMIEDQLAKLASEFAPLRAVLDKGLNGEPISKSDLDTVEQQSTKVLLAADEVVYVYEQLN